MFLIFNTLSYRNFKYKLKKFYKVYKSRLNFVLKILTNNFLIAYLTSNIKIIISNILKIYFKKLLILKFFCKQLNIKLKIYNLHKLNSKQKKNFIYLFFNKMVSYNQLKINNFI
jgi:hypothetical protein